MRIRAAFMRGGTSKALVFHARDLPAERDNRDRVLLAAMGSPDPNGRQLDGMGGGYSSVSKVCIVGPSTTPDADVDYTFAQVLVERAEVDYAGNCGNMASAIGPFAVDEGLVPAPRTGEVAVRIHNTNTGKLIRVTFPVRDGMAETRGPLRIDGVAGSGAPIRLAFLDPGGAKTGRLLPSGNVIDQLDIEGGPIEASMVDAGNPCVFVRAADLGCRGIEPVEVLEADADLMRRFEAIRRAASRVMGLTADLHAAGKLGSAPKVAMVAPAQRTTTLSGEDLGPEHYDLAVRMISMERPHRALPITGAICAAAAARLPGTIPGRFARRHGDIRLGHPSGVIVVDAEIEEQEGKPRVQHATVLRTARRLFDGHVLLDRPE